MIRPRSSNTPTAVLPAGSGSGTLTLPGGDDVAGLQPDAAPGQVVRRPQQHIERLRPGLLREQRLALPAVDAQIDGDVEQRTVLPVLDHGAVDEAEVPCVVGGDDPPFGFVVRKGPPAASAAATRSITPARREPTISTLKERSAAAATSSRS